MTTCPKCGFHQQQDTECLRCGIIFARYHFPGTHRSSGEGAALAFELPPSSPSFFRRFYNTSRWVVIAVLVLGLILVLRPSRPPQISINSQSIKRAESKIRQFVKAAKRGRFLDLEMDESELNGWLSSNLALQRTGTEKTRSAQDRKGNAAKYAADTTDALAEDDLDVEKARSKIRDVKIELLLDSLRAYVLFDFHGKDLSLELEGNLSVRNGYLHLEPRAGKLGSLPLLPVALENAAQRIFESPENREKLRLPSNIQEVRIVAGNLIVSPRQS